MSKQIKNSLRTLLAETVDYAGLFPPSKVSMETAVRNYAEYLRGEHAWLLGRFVVPAASLKDFLKEFEKVKKGGAAWRLSVIAGEEPAQDIKEIVKFNERHKDRAQIETFEVKAETPATIKAVAGELPEGLTTYFEIPSSVILADLFTTISVAKTRAKIRTGGTTVSDFPPVDDIVKFMRICAATNIPFKATAGLHHPLRGIKPLTYEKDAPKGMMNGFLNLFLTAAFLRQNPNHTFVRELMHETDYANFQFTDDGVSWKDRTVTIAEIEVARLKCAVSFGSCSFAEPIEDLQKLELI